MKSESANVRAPLLDLVGALLGPGVVLIADWALRLRLGQDSRRGPAPPASIRRIGSRSVPDTVAQRDV